MHGTLHHIEIYVKDLNETREFWGWLLKELDYIVYQEWDLGISYKLRDCYLVFVQVEPQYMALDYHRCGPGLNHLAFKRSREFIDQITVKLKNRGVQILYEGKHPYAGGSDYYAVFFEDPNRMKVEITAN